MGGWVSELKKFKILKHLTLPPSLPSEVKWSAPKGNNKLFIQENLQLLQGVKM